VDVRTQSSNGPTARWEIAVAVLVLVATLALFLKLRAADAPGPEAPRGPVTHQVTQPTSPAGLDPAPTQ